MAAGGTGGHFYPGLVLAQTLAARGWEPLMLVRQDDPAAAVLEREGIASCEIPLRGLPRRLGLPLLRFPADVARSARLTARIARDFRPAAVVGMGGYLTFPAILAAAIRGVPRAIHESNAVLGLANRASAALGAALFWGLPPARGTGAVVGTPIRRSLWTRGEAAQARARLGLAADKTTVLVFGGSQGARGINARLPALLADAARSAPGRLQALHLAGAKEAPDVEAAYRGAPLSAKVVPFLDAMELAYAASDLVVCRAGASTLAELAAQRLAAILVPFPSAAGDHQEINARALERAGAARVVLETDLAERMAPLLADLLLSERAVGARAALAQAYGNLGLPRPEDCAERLADAVETLSEKTSNSRR